MKLYLDLDGVFADFEAEASHKLGMVCGKVDDKYLWEAVNAEYRWFATLPLCFGSFSLWEYCKQFNPTFLTATGNNYEDVTEQKIDWVRNVLGDKTAPVITVRKGVDKAAYAEPGAVLVDDQPKVIAPWIAAGGIGIVHQTPKITMKLLESMVKAGV